MNLGFEYQGKVTVKVKKKGKITRVYSGKNSGLPPLFHGICNYLAYGAVGVNDKYLPKYMTLLATDSSGDSSGDYSDILQYRSKITSHKPEKDANSGVWNTTITAVVTSSQVSGTSTASAIGICGVPTTGDMDYLLATISADSLIDSNGESWDGKIPSDSAIIIDWSLYIGNK